MKSIAAYSLYSWQHRQPWLRVISPWQAAGLQVLTGTQWDQVSLEPISSSGLVLLHSDFPRLSEAYHQVIERAHMSGIPVILDIDEDIFNLPPDHPDRQFHYRSDALFPILQAIIDVDAVTVSTSALFESIQPLNPNTRLLPIYLDDRMWSFNEPRIKESGSLFIIGWINDQPATPDSFIEGILKFLGQSNEKVLLRVWGAKPPTALLDLANVDWLPALPQDYSKFAEELLSQKCDLMVIPHGKHRYLRSQSPVRFFEISACGIPGIFSRVPPYEDVISHKVNGWLADSAYEWEEALGIFLESEVARQRTAENAQSIVREEWLLSMHAESWRDLYRLLTSQTTSQVEEKPFARQATEIAGQVRIWQRELEEKIYQQEWEIRALNVMMKRKEREAGQYIDQLNTQLQSVWNSTTYRMLDKVRHPGKLFSSPEPAKAPSNKTIESQQEITSQERRNILDMLPRARSYDVLLFSKTDWGSISGRERQLLDGFIQQGSRVFQLQPSPLANSSIQYLESGVVWVPVPEAVEAETQRRFFETIRQDAQIFDAICWVEDPAGFDMAFRLRNWFDWHSIAVIDPDELPQPLRKSIYERCNLSLSPFNPIEQFSQVQQLIQDSYPKASLIVLTYNNLNYTSQCLESIFEKTSYPNFEVVIVDNASTDETPKYLLSFAETHPQVKLILNHENRGFAAGNNQGVQASTGEIVAFLNNDIVVTYGWLSRLIRHLRSPLLGAVGPVTNYAGNESRISVDYSDISNLDDFARRYTRLHQGQSFEIRMLALFCMAVRRTVIEAVGLLDERFNVGMYEDDDFSLRIRQKGYRILCAEDVYIHHWGSASFSQLAAERYQKLHEENQAKFEEKWGTRWQPHRRRMEES